MIMQCDASCKLNLQLVNILYMCLSQTCEPCLSLTVVMLCPLC